MADDVQDLRSTEPQRRTRERSEHLIQSGSAQKSWQQLALRTLRERALARQWTVQRNADGQEAIESSLFQFVNASVRNYLWKVAKGAPRDPALENKIKLFLKPNGEQGPKASDYVDTAYMLAQAPQSRIIYAKLAKMIGGANAHSSDQITKQGTRSTLSGSTTTQLQKAVARRDKIVSQILAKSGTKSDAAAQTELNDLQMHLGHLNSYIAQLSQETGYTPAQSAELDNVMSQTAASIELKRSVANLAQHLKSVNGVHTKSARQSSLPVAEQMRISARVAASRHNLMQIRANGLRLRNNFVPIESVHPDLGNVVDSALRAGWSGP